MIEQPKPIVAAFSTRTYLLTVWSEKLFFPTYPHPYFLGRGGGVPWNIFSGYEVSLALKPPSPLNKFWNSFDPENDHWKFWQNRTPKIKDPPFFFPLYRFPDITYGFCSKSSVGNFVPVVTGVVFTGLISYYEQNAYSKILTGCVRWFWAWVEKTAWECGWLSSNHF